jgi:peptidyl-prolyl cis-trans isomerase B (cyclophilin B)
MLNAIRLLCLAACAACFLTDARAQPPQEQRPETQTKQDVQTKQETPPGKETQTKQETPPAKKNARPEAEPSASPEPFDKATVEQMSRQCVTLDTEAGEINLEMFAEEAPESVRNFLNLAATHAFDTTTFSRVVPGFVVQGGNITTRERVTPELLRRASRTVPDEPSAAKHLRGTVSLARPDKPNSATTHFFILLADSPHLDGTFAAFGRVTSGMDVVDQIAAGELDGEKPKNPVRVKRFTVAPCTPLP